MQEIALALNLLDRAETLATAEDQPDLEQEARDIVAAHPDSDVSVEHIAALLRDEIADIRARNSAE
jgi:hypothetical protein